MFINDHRPRTVLEEALSSDSEESDEDSDDGPAPSELSSLSTLSRLSVRTNEVSTPVTCA